MPDSIASRSIASGLEQMERLSGLPTFTWKGAEVYCTASSLRFGTAVSVGGFEYPIECTLFVRKTYFLTIDSTLVTIDSVLYTIDNDMLVPLTGRKLTFRGKEYRIVGCRESGPRSHYELDIADAKI